MNGDGFADVLVGDPDGGRSYVIFGAANRASVVLNGLGGGLEGIVITPDHPRAGVLPDGVAGGECR